MTTDLRRSALYKLASSDRAASLARSHPWVERRLRRRARRYVAGETRAAALETVQRLHAAGLAASVDFLGEGVEDEAAARAVVEEYVAVAGELAALERDVSVWIDPANIGAEISDSACQRNAERIAAALAPGTRLHVRAHDSARMDSTLDLVTTLAAAGNHPVATLAANLRRSAEDAERLIEQRIPVLLVKGASLEPPALAHRWGEETDRAYLRLAHQLHARGAGLSIGTHDPVLSEALLTALDGIEVETLLGVREPRARELARGGQSVRVYAPYGDDWMRYWLRRVAAAPSVRAGLAATG